MGSLKRLATPASEKSYHWLKLALLVIQAAVEPSVASTGKTARIELGL